MEEDPKRREAEARDDGGSGKGRSGKGEKGKIALENEEKTGGGETKSSGCGWARGIQTTLVFLGFLLLVRTTLGGLAKSTFLFMR